MVGLYKIGLKLGFYRKDPHRPAGTDLLRPLFELPDPGQLLAVIGEEGKVNLLAEAEEVVGGKARLFGAQPVALMLAPEGPPAHWTEYESGKIPVSDLNLPHGDIKFLWEPARFGWAFPLGRAFHITRDEKYAQAFWQHLESFLEANPPYLGPNWTSGQEVALRVLAFVWADVVFASAAASTPERRAVLARTVGEHAARIPATLLYARSQDNNHLLSEAIGLWTAGLALAGQPEAQKWKRLGWTWLNAGFQQQIDGYGEYSQHSSNYHRLMLQLALWVDMLLKSQDERWPRQTLGALQRGTHWLLALLDPDSGRTPNLGANDGAHILPLTGCPFADFRPVLHAAGRAFLEYTLPAGPWDEAAYWLGIPLGSKKYVALSRYPGDHLYGPDSWAYLRAAKFDSRPSHADQLHLDLWWRGDNLALDPGTYLYNATPPWDNSLTTTLVHNTVTLDGKEQMLRAGRFLYLDWADAYWKDDLDLDEKIIKRVRGHHYGYWRKGVRHGRTVKVLSDHRWMIEDDLIFLPWLPFAQKERCFRLHWLLPDWEWQLHQEQGRITLRLSSPHGLVTLQVLASEPDPDVRLVRGGERIYGQGDVLPIMGWVSPTYGQKLPALSFEVGVRTKNDVQFTSIFELPR